MTISNTKTVNKYRDADEPMTNHDSLLKCCPYPLQLTTVLACGKQSDVIDVEKHNNSSVDIDSWFVRESSKAQLD